MSRRRGARSTVLAFLALFAVSVGLRVLALAAEFPAVLVLAATGVVVWRRRTARTPAASVPDARTLPGLLAENDQLRAELAQVRGRVTRLEDAANRPIDAVIASYERIAQRYGSAAAGKTGDPR